MTRPIKSLALLALFVPAGAFGQAKLPEPKPVRVLRVDVNTVGNVLTGEDDLWAYTLDAAKYLAGNGYGIRITASGTFASNANTKQIRFQFGATNLLANFSASSNGATWMLRVTILRTSVTAQSAMGEQFATDTNGRQGVTTFPAENLALPVSIRLTGEATATNDIVKRALMVEVFEPEEISP